MLLVPAQLFSHEQLVRYYPEKEEYRLCHAQSLLKAAAYEEVIPILNNFKSSQFQRILLMQAAAYYEQDDLSHPKSILSYCSTNDPEASIIDGAIMYK